MNIKVEQLELVDKRMIIKQDKPSDIVAAGGLVVAAAQTQNQADIPTGVIVSIGDQVTKYKVGDHVLFGPYAGQQIPLNSLTNDVYLLMSEAEPIAKLKN